MATHDERLEARFARLQKRLEAIESAIPLASELVSLGERLNIPLNIYQTQLKQFVVLSGLAQKIPGIGTDEMSKAILQSLLEKEDANISHITRTMLRLRGKASRRIVAERLEKLESLGIVAHRRGRNNEKLYRLNAPEKQLPSE